MCRYNSYCIFKPRIGKKHKLMGSLFVIQQVLRQTTLPIVPTRHQTFQRQLSHRLELPNIQFSICSLEHRSDSSIGLIKVSG